jgi:hypothetical protein
MIYPDKFLWEFQTRKEDRLSYRGLMPFYQKLFTDCQPTTDHFRVIVELGIGGGGSFKKKADAADGFHKIGGVERFHPELMPNIGSFELENDDYLCSLTHLETTDNLYFLHGKDAYQPSTVDDILEFMGEERIDLLIDDAATEWPRQKESLPIWRRAVSDHGIYISEVPDGMGVPSWWAMTREQHISNFQELAEYGLVTFDFEEYHRITLPEHEIYNAHFLSIWCPNWDLYRPVIEEFKHCIVAGEENVRYKKL